MKARIIRNLPKTPLPATHEYRAKPPMPQGLKTYDREKQKKPRQRVRPEFHVWTDEERDDLVEKRKKGWGWAELAELYGVTKNAAQRQEARRRRNEC